jgi:hypothetical protein
MQQRAHAALEAHRDGRLLEQDDLSHRRLRRELRLDLRQGKARATRARRVVNHAR